MAHTRYKYTGIKTNKLGTRVYKPTLYPDIPIEDGDTYVITKYGDRLDNLSYKYYGTTSYWWILARANNIENGKFSLKAGVELRVPSDINKVFTLLEAKNKLM